MSQDRLTWNFVLHCADELLARFDETDRLMSVLTARGRIFVPGRAVGDLATNEERHQREEIERHVRFCASYVALAGRYFGLDRAVTEILASGILEAIREYGNDCMRLARIEAMRLRSVLQALAMEELAKMHAGNGRVACPLEYFVSHGNGDPEVARFLANLEAQQASRPDTSLPATENNEVQGLDGPVPPNWFVHGPGRARVQPQVWRFLNLLWRERRVTLDRIQEVVWGPDEDDTAHALNSVLKKARAALREASAPYEIQRHPGGVIFSASADT